MSATAPALARPITVLDVLIAATVAYGVPWADFAGRTRYRRVVECRRVAWVLCRQLTRGSFPEIAAASGRSGHSTVVESVSVYAPDEPSVLGEGRTVGDWVREIGERLQTSREGGDRP